jgi:DNA-binding MarR family transcriptional regulator
MATNLRDELCECASCACFAVRRAARVITQHYDRSLRSSGLRATQFTLLTVLALGGPLSMRRVADRLGMERTTLTRNLRRLLTKKLVAIRHGDDRRVRTIAITAKGRRAAVAALPHWRKAQRDLGGHLTAGVLASLDVAARALPGAEPGHRQSRATHEKEIDNA